jgi:methionyl-tRNA formyltransferase
MKNKKYKIVFMGTPEFSALILEKLTNSSLFCPQIVITAPDQLQGRKRILQPPPVKKTALKANLKVWQPISFQNNKEIKEKLEEMNPDLFIVAAYGFILPLEILQIPSQGALNVHPSLLPRYRGASPLQQTILNGDLQTGTTIILMDEKVDHGPIVKQKKLEKSLKEIDYPELNTALAHLSAELLLNLLPDFLQGKIKLQPQKHNLATFTKKIKKEDGKINWEQSAEKIERKTRAYRPWPGSYGFLNLKKITIIKARVWKTRSSLRPGTLFLKNKIPAVACGKDALILEELQMAGKNSINGQNFVNGYSHFFNQIME